METKSFLALVTVTYVGQNGTPLEKQKTKKNTTGSRAVELVPFVRRGGLPESSDNELRIQLERHKTTLNVYSGDKHHFAGNLRLFLSADEQDCASEKYFLSSLISGLT